jgi:hypothetical protein
VERSSELINANNILSDNSDSYLYTVCEKKVKFIIVRLSEDILLESFQIYNQEYYSNNIKKLKLYGCINYPCQEWQSIGEFTMQNVKN